MASMNLQTRRTFGRQFSLVFRGTKLYFIRSKTRLNFIHLTEKCPYLLSFWKCVQTFLIKRIILTLSREPSCFFFLIPSVLQDSSSRLDTTQSFALVFKALPVALVRENFFITFFIVFHLLGKLFLTWSCLLNNLKAVFGSSNLSTSQEKEKNTQLIPVTKSRPQESNPNGRLSLEECLPYIS